MILTICSDKGSPGVSTAAVALSVMWPGERVLLEADPSGGDLSLRLRTEQGETLSLDRSVTSLAADAREGLTDAGLTRYAQQTSLCFPVLLGPMSAEGFEPMARVWPQVAAAAHAWAGTVVADVGRLQLHHSSSPLAAASTVVLLLTRGGTSEDLFHVRQRAHELAGRLGQGPHGRSPLAVAVVAAPRSARERVAQVQHALSAQATTSTVPVAGFLAHDEKAVAALREGVVTKRLLGSDLLKSATELVYTIIGSFPEIAAANALGSNTASPLQDHPTTVGMTARQRPMTLTGDQPRSHWATPVGPMPAGGSR